MATWGRGGSRPAITAAWAIVALTASATLGLPNAWANEGATIAAAPQLPLDQSTASGYVQMGPEPLAGEYWRVEMPAGALLTFDGSVASTCGENNHHPEAYIYVFPPSTTEYTRREVSGVTDQALNPNGELRFTAPYSGNWLLEIGIGGASCGDFADTFTAKVQIPTHASLTGPSASRSNKSFSLTGSVAGVATGTVVIAVRIHHHWIAVASEVPIIGGLFHWKGKAGPPGRYSYQVSYTGDDGHLPSSAQHILIVR